MTDPLTLNEIATRRRLTTEMIQANPSTVVLSRQSYVDDGAGGQKKGPIVELDPAVIRIIALNREVPQRTTVDGRTVTPSYRLLADSDADVRRGDYFTRDGARFEVVWVEPDHLDATRAELVYGE
jgi:hypothetical protein